MSERDPLQALWTRQQQEPFTMTSAQLRQRATRFQSKIRTRNRIEYAAAALVTGVFAWMVVIIPEPMVRAGAGLITLGTLYVCWKLHTLAGETDAGGLDHAASLADFHRAELLRQRTALASVWQWYLAPFVPGMLVFIGAVAFTPELDAPLIARLTFFGSTAAPIAGVFGLVAWLNARAVKALDAEIKALDGAN
ncbi:hypothetical protein [Hyphomonas sp.]|uniref:hypothetical protein n=1 Tax=Hyphomonas sp. TaxID=87 RepID=UPI0025C3EE1F|nr:hypothetical protein [Hyphomonas sp.]